MGVADAIPGVSGGTVALILGIYERLISAISSVKPVFFKQLGFDLLKRDWDRFRRDFKRFEGFFLISLAAGILSAVILVLNFVNYLLGAYPAWVYGFFFGLIGVSAFLLLDEFDFRDFSHLSMLFAGFLVSFLVSGFAVNFLDNSLPVVFVSGLLAASAKILPGISGSLILLMMGQYEYMTGVLSDFTGSIVGVFRDGGVSVFLDSSIPVLVFMSGSLTGLFSIANLVKKLLDKNRAVTMSFLIGMIIGSLRAPIEQVSNVEGIRMIEVVPEFGLSTVLGVSIILLFDKFYGFEY